MKTSTLLLFLPIIFSFSNAQDFNSRKLVGGRCEGCKAVFEFGNSELASVDTLIDFQNPGTKIKLTGTVYKSDGKTPAENVILYIYHTNQDGIYPTRGDEEGWARRHGYIRGWVKTDSSGKYSFYTLKPAVYPSRSEPAHIHLTVLEPDGKYYWVESYLFDDDPLLKETDFRSSSNRGGIGNILHLEKQNDLQIGRRNVILGKDIPGYE